MIHSDHKVAQHLHNIGYSGRAAPAQTNIPYTSYGAKSNNTSNKSNSSNIFDNDDEEELYKPQQRSGGNRTTSTTTRSRDATSPFSNYIGSPLTKTKDFNFFKSNNMHRQPEASKKWNVGNKPVFSKEDIDFIVEHDVPRKPETRNIMLEEDTPEEMEDDNEGVLNMDNLEIDGKPKQANGGDDIIDVGGVKFDQLLRQIFKNPRTGEMDIDDEDIKDMQRMFLLTSSPSLRDVIERSSVIAKEEQRLKNEQKGEDEDK
eukprot:gene3830-4421_t